MTKEIIIKKLQSNHNEFIDQMLSMRESDFTFSVNDKWTAGQQFEHIYLSVSPLTKALLLPAFLLKLIFGKANRPSKDYETLVKKYHDKLEKGGAASGRFVPKQISYQQRDELTRRLLKTVMQLCKTVDRFSEAEMDILILPHPLLGKLTLREMLYFTMYHVEHHKNLVLNVFNKK